MTPAEIADRLASYSARLRNGSLYRAHALWTTWNSFNAPKNRLKSDDIRRHSGATTLNLLASAALHETIMIAVRAIDSSGRKGALKSNRVSFPVMVELMDLEGVADELVVRAQNWFEDGYKAAENADSVRRAMDQFRVLTGTLTESDAATKLRDFRDEFLAHNLEFETERKRPIISHVTELLAALTKISDKASLAFEGSSTAWEFGEEERERSATNLWELIEAGARKD